MFKNVAARQIRQFTAVKIDRQNLSIFKPELIFHLAKISCTEVYCMISTANCLV